MDEEALYLIVAVVMWAAVLGAGALVLYAIVGSVVAVRKFRAQAPALVREAMALTEEQIVDLSDDKLWNYRRALDYARRYQRRALYYDLELASALGPIVDEQTRRIERDLAISRAEDIARVAAMAERARRDLGL